MRCELQTEIGNGSAVKKTGQRAECHLRLPARIGPFQRCQGQSSHYHLQGIGALPPRLPRRLPVEHGGLAATGLAGACRRDSRKRGIFGAYSIPSATTLRCWFRLSLGSQTSCCTDQFPDVAVIQYGVACTPRGKARDPAYHECASPTRSWPRSRQLWR